MKKDAQKLGFTSSKIIENAIAHFGNNQIAELPSKNTMYKNILKPRKKALYIIPVENYNISEKY